MMDDDVTAVRPCHEADVPGVLSLFASVFGRNVTAEHWHWKLGARSSKTVNVLLALHGDRPVFQYAGIPTVFSLRGERVNAMVSVDTMTAPDFRRRGLLTRVATAAYARWSDSDVRFVLGLPNEQWGSRAAALGWRPLFELQRLVRPLRPEALVAHRFGMQWLRRLTLASGLWNGVFARPPRRDPGVHIQLVSNAGDEFDRLWDVCRSNASFSVVRDRAWVQWRFLDCPSRRYRVLLATRDHAPAGYCAYSVHESNGRRGALLAEMAVPQSDRAARRTLLAHLLQQLQSENVEYVSTLAVPGSPLHRELRAAAFFAGPAFSVQMVPLGAKLPIDEMRQAANWDLSGAAFDVI